MKILKENGITLIALVITVILLLILAGVTLNILFNLRIIENSQKSVDKYKEQQAKEKLEIAISDYKASQYTDYRKTFENAVKDVGGTLLYHDNEYNVQIDGFNFKVNNSIINDFNKPFLQNKEASFQNPVIPVGFKPEDTKDAHWNSTDGNIVDDWNKGLVIQDYDGNEFVWIPVHSNDIIENENTIEKVLYKKIDADSTYYSVSQVSDDDLPDKVQLWYEKTIDKELGQIEKYGGFYIARYEAGIPVNELSKDAINNASSTYRNTSNIGKPLSMQNQIPWNYIDYKNAQINAESMYSTEYVQSGLLTGRMWDTTLTWLKNNGVDIEKDCKDWGNYSNVKIEGITQYSITKGEKWISDQPTKDIGKQWLLKTGNVEFTRKNNIYDLAGNLWEWINEYKTTNENDCIARGGCFINDSNYCIASFRNNGNDNVSEYYGRRI